MQVESTSLPGVLVLRPRVFEDARGFFLESYNQETLRAYGIDAVFVQDNHSKSTRGTLRGLHYQLPPAAQVKLVRVVRGAVWDVAVDIRVGSPTFGQSVGVELSAENFHQLYIPSGFAHGFCVLSEEAEVLYKASHVYSPTHERGIVWNDTTLQVAWPMAEPLLSERDRRLGTLADYLSSTPFVHGECAAESLNGARCLE
jgi:dTDP-4-dehydrorhamnose 3,5-epimerase